MNNEVAVNKSVIKLGVDIHSASYTVVARFDHTTPKPRPILEIHDAKMADLTRQLEAAAHQELPQGLGKLASLVINREICDWNRFHNRRQASAYTGLCPGEHSSGERRLQDHVTKHGNQRLRCMLVELAWRMVRFQPAYPQC